MADVDASATFFGQVADFHAATKSDSVLWITETAFSAAAPADASRGGQAADAAGMLRAADVQWNLDALGAAAEKGVDVFCRETLAGDWLETVGLWQQGDGAFVVTTQSNVSDLVSDHLRACVRNLTTLEPL